QSHLERLSSNAQSVHHVLEALCGGMDRLEKKIDANSAQVESRLANIVHHMSGEADEDTMSAWGSLGGGLASPAELGPSLPLRRRSSFGMHMSSFSEEPFLEPPVGRTSLNGEGADVARSGDQGKNDLGTFGSVVDRTKEKATGGGTEALTAGQSDLSSSDRNPNNAATRRPASETAEERTAVPPAVDRQGSDGVSSNPPDSGDERAKKALASLEGTKVLQPRRRSNQDDQSDGLNSKINSARSGEDERDPRTSMSEIDSVHGEETASNAEGSEYPLTALIVEGSVESGGSDARYIARQRWIWAFGRVCQLVRRRKRKQFEIMSQRATDRTVRMGSRVSVVEKRLDETREHMLVVDRLKDKSSAHTAQIKNLGETVTSLCKLFGVEERLRRTMQDSQTKLETSLKSDLSDLEAKLTSRQYDMEKSLDSDIQRHGAKLKDIDDRYARSEDALRRAEERIGEVQEEISGVTQSISEIERQLRVDQGRLDTLENLKKAHQRRLSELRVKLEDSTTSAGIAVPIDTEPVETDDERMNRHLRAAGAAAEFLSTDLGKILDNSSRSSSDLSCAALTATNDSAAKDDSLRDAGVHNDEDGGHMMERLRHISIEAAEYSRLCSNSPNEKGDDDLSIRTAVERSEALCGRIDALLSTPNGSGDNNNVDNGDDGMESAAPRTTALARNGSSDSNSDPGQKRSANSNVSSIADVVCPNGRKDLALRLAAARDAFLPLIGECTNLGSLRMDLLRLTTSVRISLEPKQGLDTLEARWKTVSSQVSGLADSVNDIESSLHSNRQHRRGSTLDDDGGGGGDGVGGVTEEDLDDRLGYKADVSWVQRELKRLWEALDSRAMASVVAASGAATAGQDGDASRPRSAPSSKDRSSSASNNKENNNPETAGEEESDVDTSVSLTPNSRAISTSLPSSSSPLSGSLQAEHRSRSSFNEGSSLIKDLLRKTSRLEQQMSSKADSDEVMKTLSSVGNKLRKVGVVIPAIQEELSQKIERKDLAKLVALVSSGGNLSDAPPGEYASGKNPSDDNNDTTAVLASRLNSKFRCLSCDRPLPALGPPGPPKLNASGLSIAGAGAPRSPQRTKASPGQHRVRQTAGGSGGDSSSRPNSPVVVSPTLEDVGDVAGWGSAGGEGSGMTLARASDSDSACGHSKDSAGSRWRHQQQMHQHRGGEPPGGRLEPLGANGEQMAAVLSRYPRMMPPPSRIRTAAGGGIGSRPGSSTGDGYRR
ncbi:unnamed protein product, partial [Scytosiphon promiscuus]